MLTTALTIALIAVSLTGLYLRSLAWRLESALDAQYAHSAELRQALADKSVELRKARGR